MNIPKTNYIYTSTSLSKKLFKLVLFFALIFSAQAVKANVLSPLDSLSSSEESSLNSSDEKIMSFDEAAEKYLSDTEREDRLSREIDFEEAGDTGHPQNLVVDIEADEVRYDQKNNYYEAIGDAQTFLPSKNITIYADAIYFNGISKLLEASGTVRVVHGEDTIRGEYVSYHLDSRRLSMESPRVFLKGVKLKARTAYSFVSEKPGSKDKEAKEDPTVVYLDQGVLALNQPMLVYFRPNGGKRTRYSINDDFENKTYRPAWEDLPDKPSFKYSAEEILYDDTKTTNNLRIKGARVWLNEKLSLPIPVTITTTTGEASESRYIGPVFGTNTRIGGFAFGPRFYYAKDDGIASGVYALAPILQIGNNFDFGAGAIVSYNKPADTTAIMAGYGSLEERFIANAHQELPWGFEANYLMNQQVRGENLGISQVGQFAQLAHRFRWKVPFADRAYGIRINNSFGYAQDNNELFSNRRLKDLKEERGDGRQSFNFDDNYSDFRSSHNIDFYTAPIWRLGNEKYNLAMSARFQDSLRFYGSGDMYNILRFGPAIQFGLEKLVFELSYLSSVVSGESPFLFDQFVGGKQAIQLDGDFQVNDWVSVGTYLSYNLDRERFSNAQLRTDFGPKDFKFRIAYDSIRNQIGFGLNMFFGDPISYDQLELRM